jgi:hypothetical protein
MRADRRMGVVSGGSVGRGRYVVSTGTAVVMSLLIRGCAVARVLYWWVW